MISKGEKEKQRKDLNKFIEQNVQGINKIGLHKKGGGGRRPPPPFVGPLSHKLFRQLLKSLKFISKSLNNLSKS